MLEEINRVVIDENDDHRQRELLKQIEEPEHIPRQAVGATPLKEGAGTVVVEDEEQEPVPPNGGSPPSAMLNPSMMRHLRSTRASPDRVISTLDGTGEQEK